ncbi:MAG: integrase core domain-containing protein [Xanthomonadales bacterium]|nr:integrase core domain-containing protein [Xanthomonadales bacterium]MCP5476462.1 transposase [Rhodanobacteraceae bacterium]
MRLLDDKHKKHNTVVVAVANHLARHGALSSMSRVGNCWDNAVAERFFLNLKMERVWQRDYANAAEAERDVSDYIVNFYNDRRLSSRLNNQSPNVFEQRQAA